MAADVFSIRLALTRHQTKTSLGVEMPDPVEALVKDLLDWVGPRSRPYPEVMDAWRTSCPRLPIWEEALSRGFVECTLHPERGRLVQLTERGLNNVLQRRERP
jgi:D-3-phosphoglycerate dehydrogenase